ncbi:trypsin-like peptidase domain-containing protein [Aurantimonas sp. C2-6-R+9]|uniref:S1C family serine protease n=1 Tax=unclassified Aurantimonas TaxID=2638230 RepID=UPI002E176887|nr:MULTISPECIES: trypsin-like peptidase domain-containing protein [unclassified Aurantimonas]MEC5289473.1 trypsin-like peptidase domain-containing protein [Aurantimonas sp. C2-3-R2]MEC5322981.1 trypsin-like peptidase domain-containing protein [Aurantimonas sp. A3-2-R12]MEC5380830.1 trypsin-like peptidase domain-containing protein [Aurantimonas sp. C2-6-R+9]MEC5410554.1 trypsin-like peptidase domain-containing protein [Aurantimonas sp. C2-4-R8]
MAISRGLAALLALALAGFAAGAGTADALEAGNWRTAIATVATQSVVAVLPVLPTHEINQEEPEGTGFAIRDGRTIVTADHVLGRANAVRLRLSSGAVRSADIALRDADTDIALLHVSDALPPLAFSADARTGADACVLGNAFGLGISLACGVISATERRGVGFNRIEDFIQTDAAINPGMSGAPLITADGNVAGMASAIFTKSSDGNLGVNFVASARLLEAVLDDAEDGRIDRRAAGVILRPLPAPGETGEPGAEVVRVAPGSPEDRAGITAGDRIRAIGDLPVRGQPDYLTALVLDAGQETLTFSIERAGELLDILVHDKSEKGKNR